MSLHRVPTPAHCPHCMSVVSDRMPWPPTAARCPVCRLIIGAGRAIDFDEASTRLGATSSAAGIAANAARSIDADPVDEGLIATGLRTVAAVRGEPVRRLRMLDYVTYVAQDAQHPSLAEVLVTCGSWKRARRIAERRPSQRLDPSLPELQDERRTQPSGSQTTSNAPS